MIEYTGTFKTIQDVVDWINNYTPEAGAPGYLKVADYDSSEYHYPSENIVYKVGDHVVYEDDLYVCITQVTVLDESFDTNKWTLMDTIPEQVFSKPGKIVSNEGGEIFNSLSTNVASGNLSHAEGYNTKATNGQAHAEGNNTIASGYASHAEGDGTTASNNYAHAEGTSTAASGYGSHVEGYHTKATNYYAHAEGNYTEANGQYSHVEGNNCKSYSNASASHVEGQYCEASGYYAHVEGQSCKDYGYNNHVEGQACQAESSTRMCHVEGYQSKALNGDEGKYNTAEYAHAEGYYCEAKSSGAHAEGYYSKAHANYSHAGGSYSQTLGYCSFTHGENTKSNVAYETSFGRYNATSDDGSSYSWWGSWNSYSTGDIVNHSNDGNIYQANQDIPSGTAWDATMWDIIGTYETDPANIVQFSYGYGGSDNSRTNLFDVRRNGDGYLGGNKIITNAIIPDPPTTDGTYTLQCTVTNGVATYAWV